MAILKERRAKHIHKLKRHKYKGGNVIYFCTLPDCNYKTATGLALGKRVLCSRCGNPFIMSEYSIRLANPHCEECHNPKIKPEITQENVIERVNDSSDKSIEDMRSRFNQAIHSFQAKENEDDEDLI